MIRGFFSSLFWRLEVQDQVASFIEPLPRAFCRWYSGRSMHKRQDSPHGRQESPHGGVARLTLYENLLSQELIWEDRLNSRRPAFFHSWSQTPMCASHFLSTELDTTVHKETTFKLWHNPHPLALWLSSWRFLSELCYYNNNNYYCYYSDAPETQAFSAETCKVHLIEKEA